MTRRRHRRYCPQGRGRIVRRERLTIVSNKSLPTGWTGKLWAVKRGIAAAEEKFARNICCCTDADIPVAMTPNTVSWLVGHAEAHKSCAHVTHRALALRRFAEPCTSRPSSSLPDALSVRNG